MGEKTDACRALVAKPEGKRLLGRPGHRWEDCIKVNLKQDGRLWAQFVWFRIEISDGHLQTL
jgi:hypothetical protein